MLPRQPPADAMRGSFFGCMLPPRDTRSAAMPPAAAADGYFSLRHMLRRLRALMRCVDAAMPADDFRRFYAIIDIDATAVAAAALRHASRAPAITP